MSARKVSPQAWALRLKAHRITSRQGRTRDNAASANHASSLCLDGVCFHPQTSSPDFIPLVFGAVRLLFLAAASRHRSSVGRAMLYATDATAPDTRQHQHGVNTGRTTRGRAGPGEEGEEGECMGEAWTWLPGAVLGSECTPDSCGGSYTGIGVVAHIGGTLGHH